MSKIKSRRVLCVIIVVTGRCRMHKTQLAAFTRIGYIMDGY